MRNVHVKIEGHLEVSLLKLKENGKSRSSSILKGNEKYRCSSILKENGKLFERRTGSPGALVFLRRTNRIPAPHFQKGTRGQGAPPLY